MIKKILFSTVTFFLSIDAFAQLNIRLSANEIAYGTPVNLIFESDLEIKNLPDLATLLTDVSIKGKSQSSSIQSINGNVSKLYKISFTIFPLKKGEIQIGPFNINGQEYNAIKLNVVDKPIQTPNQPNNTIQPSIELPIFELSINHSKIYEGQLAVYQTKLYETSPLQGVQITPPRIQNLKFDLLENDQLMQEMKNEKLLRLFKRSFVITPSETGNYQIPSATLSGNLILPQEKTRLTDDFFNIGFTTPFYTNLTKPFLIQSNSISLEVLKKPLNWEGWWFPTHKAELTEEYTIPETIYEGDVIERKIILKATGIDLAKLPLISIPSQTNISLFPNPEERFSFLNNGEITSVENRTFLLIPQRQGKLTIPAVKIKYFNTETEKEETLTLPAKEIFVLAAKKQPQTVTTNSDNTPPNDNKTPPKKTDTTQKTNIPKWVISTICFSLVSGILALLIFWQKRKKKKLTTLMSEKTIKTKKKKKPLPDLYPF